MEETVEIKYASAFAAIEGETGEFFMAKFTLVYLSLAFPVPISKSR